MNEAITGPWSPADIARLRLVDTQDGIVLADLQIALSTWKVEDDGLISNEMTYRFHMRQAGTPGRIEALDKAGRRLAGGTVADNGQEMGRCTRGDQIILAPGTLRLGPKQ